MRDCEFTSLGDGRFAVSGSLALDTAADAYAESMVKFTPFSELEIDLSGVVRADSAGLALMLEWGYWARSTAREIQFKNIPDQILGIARISEVEGILSAGERWMFPASMVSNES